MCSIGAREENYLINEELLKRWRLILGKTVQDQMDEYSALGLELNKEETMMDEALAAIYDNTEKHEGKSSQGRIAGLGPSAPNVAKWLGDIRSLFSQDVVSVIQSDAIERKGLTQLLFEPETLKNVKPDIEMVATLMSLRGKIPEKTKDTARQVVKAVVDEVKKILENDIRRAVAGVLNRREHSPIPNVSSIDWKHTINRNLKNYNKDMKTIIPERFYFFSKAKRTNNWNVILDMDQSGSMAESIIYGSILGSVIASIPALNTRIVAFDTEVVDLSQEYGNDPVDMLFGIQLGGGTDINKSVAYCQQFITEPSKTLFFLLTDLYEGGNQSGLIKRISDMHEAGVRVVVLLALSDRGRPTYDENLAKRISQIGVPCFACTPKLLPQLLEGALKGNDLNELARKIKSQNKI